MVVGSEAEDTSVEGVFTTSPSNSSLGENLKAGNRRVLMVRSYGLFQVFRPVSKDVVLLRCVVFIVP